VTVWLIQRPPPQPRTAADGSKVYWEPDLSSAAQYGPISTIFEADARPALTPGPSIHHIRKILREYNEGDFFLWAGGDPAALFMVGAIVQEVAPYGTNFLRWERVMADGRRTGQGFYIPVRITFREKKDG
jgi:hypothetical protein